MKKLFSILFLFGLFIFSTNIKAFELNGVIPEEIYMNEEEMKKKERVDLKL